MIGSSDDPVARASYTRYDVSKDEPGFAKVELTRVGWCPRPSLRQTGHVTVRMERRAGRLHLRAVLVAGVPVDRVSAGGQLVGERDERPDVAVGGHRGEEEARHAAKRRRPRRARHRGFP